MKKEKLYFYTKILSIFGILLAVYLLWQQFFRPVWQPCSINSLVNCDAIISGGVAKTFGVPTPLIGLIGYIIIFLSSIFRWKKNHAFYGGFWSSFLFLDCLPRIIFTSLHLSGLYRLPSYHGRGNCPRFNNQ